MDDEGVELVAFFGIGSVFGQIREADVLFQANFEVKLSLPFFLNIVREPVEREDAIVGKDGDIVFPNRLNTDGRTFVVRLLQFPHSIFSSSSGWFTCLIKFKRTPSSF